MAKQPRNKLSKLDILKVTSEMFLEKGVSATYPYAICDRLDISPGTLTYHFNKKEDIFATFIQLLGNFQWKLFREWEDDGETPITALCLELIAMAAMCDDNEVARDIYINAYTNSKSLSIIRRNDMQRAKEVFAEFCPDWSDEMFVQAEMLVSGIEYAALHTTPESPPLESRIAGAMEVILSIYNVPSPQRQMKIQKALSMDYLEFGRRVFEKFKAYMENTLEEMTDDITLNRESKLVNILYEKT